MEQVFLFVITGLLLIAIFLLIRRNPKNQDSSFLMLQNQINQLNETIGKNLTESSRIVQGQVGQSMDIIKKVTEELTGLKETNRQVVSYADQLNKLQDILKNPKQRGVLGEYYLETVLKNVLPPGTYQMQYKLGRDEQSGKDLIVDAVVFVGKNIIPIDSKFSLENYNRMVEAPDANEKKRCEIAFVSDLKNRIEETAKYVKPEKKTMDFAFMFIPSEAVYYDLLINKVGAITEETNNLIYYAGRKKVIVVSPTSFLAYLQTVLQGLRNQKISEQANEIIKEVERLGKHLSVYNEHMKKMGSHLGVTVSTFNRASTEFKKIDKDVVKITGNDSKLKTPKEIDQPLSE